jgi:mono/diheme cytochrome c family protein
MSGGVPLADATRDRFPLTERVRMRGYMMLGAVGVIAVSAWRPDGASSMAARWRTAQEPDGKMVYVAHCKVCHGAIGDPTKTAKAKYEKIPSFRDSAFFAVRTPDSVVTILKKGKGKDMKSFAGKLTDAQMAAVAQYIRTLAAKR